MSAVVKDAGVSPHLLGDVCVGNVLQPGAGALMARVAHFLSGFPDSVPVYAVNRQCASGLQAVLNVAGAIRSGSIDLGLACGVESMSLRSMQNPGDLSSRLADNDKARDCIIPMGVTSENVAERFGISREKQDAFALTSHQKAARAQASGAFRDELVPVVTKMAAQDGSERQAKVTEDDGVRPGSTLAALAKLPAVFKAGGTTTAGNSSQVSDGAAAVLLGRRAVVEALGLPVLGVLRASAVVGVPPDVMGIGPAFAIPEALRRAGKMTSQGALRRRFTSFSGPFSVRACVRLRTQDWAWPTWTCLRSTRPSPARRCTAWRSWASPGRRSTPTAAPSLWATRWAAPARGRSSRCCTTSDDAAQGTRVYVSFVYCTVAVCVRACVQGVRRGVHVRGYGDGRGRRLRISRPVSEQVRGHAHKRTTFPDWWIPAQVERKVTLSCFELFF
ncbi:3-ketoacyl-CoA thiolase, peroxisomal isoform X6 [Vanacampus margaritifer]